MLCSTLLPYQNALTDPLLRCPITLYPSAFNHPSPPSPATQRASRAHDQRDLYNTCIVSQLSRNKYCLNQMVCFQIVSPSNGHLYPCFPRKKVRLKSVSPSNGPLYPSFPRKWYALKFFFPQITHLSMIPSQIICLKIISSSNGPLSPCFLCKWYVLKVLLPQMALFIHVSHANGIP